MALQVVLNILERFVVYPYNESKIWNVFLDFLVHTYVYSVVKCSKVNSILNTFSVCFKKMVTHLLLYTVDFFWNRCLVLDLKMWVGSLLSFKQIQRFLETLDWILDFCVVVLHFFCQLRHWFLQDLPSNHQTIWLLLHDLVEDASNYSWVVDFSILCFQQDIGSLRKT